MSRRILVIGGGFTALAAARVLARSGTGLHITLLEGGRELGGLAAGFRVCGTSLERTYHYLLRGDAEIIELIRELGLGSELMFRDGSVGIWDGHRVYPLTTALDVLRFSPCSVTERLRLGFAIFRLQRTRNWRPFVAETAKSWLERICGPCVMREIWEPLLRGKFDRYADQVSMAWLWARIHTRANSRAFGRERAGYLRGGFAVLVDRLAGELAAAGVELRTGTRVARLDTAARCAVLEGGGTVGFDRCLFTGSSPALARVLPVTAELDGYRAQLGSIAWLGAICVVFVTDQELTRQHWLSIHDPASPFLVLINHTRLVGTDLYQGRHVYYLGCYRPHDHPMFTQDEDVLMDQWFAFLRRVCPQFDRARVSEQHVFRFSHAQHVVDCDYERRKPGFRTPLPGVYLANFSQIFPEDRGTNYAVRDGQAVARLIVDDEHRGEFA
jgi:protoporphyrinogen oxidase